MRARRGGRERERERSEHGKRKGVLVAWHAACAVLSFSSCTVAPPCRPVVTMGAMSVANSFPILPQSVCVIQLCVLQCLGMRCPAEYMFAGPCMHRLFLEGALQLIRELREKSFEM